MRIQFIVPIVLALLSGCDKGAGNRAGDTGGATSDPGSTPSDPGGTGTATGLSFEPLTTSSLYTSDTADNSCVSFTIKAVNGAVPSADTGITLTVDSTMGDKGTINPNSGVTDSSGNFKSSYCSGKNEGTAVISAKAGTISANSSKITVTVKAAFAFIYSSSDLPGTTIADQTLYMNTLDSGPNDCTILYFKLSKSGKGVTGATVDFTTQVDYPSGVKLAKRADPAVTDTDPKTNKKFAKFSAISSGTGEFAVPICTGVSLGSVLVSGSYLDVEEDRVYTVRSPVVRITSGLTNFINYSLTFDPMNARTLRGYYNTNSEYDLPFSVALGARFDGEAIADYPVSIATEVGRYTMPTGGFLDPETLQVPVKLHALHLVDNYPYPILKFWDGNAANNIYPLAQTRCEPNQIAAWIKDKNAGADLSYSELRKNWTSSLVYAVRGQEYFYDANRNGVYDAGGTGFWDKNQNGIYDAGDVVTYPAGGVFNAQSEWFIDLPTPFVDVNDDGVFTETIDYLLGDKYIEPNGKRDADALIWKKETFPISMGPSSFSLRTNVIQATAGGLLKDPIHAVVDTGNPFTSRYAYGQSAIDSSFMWTPAQVAAANGTWVAGVYRFVNYMHDLCGNMLPGGTGITYSVVTGYTPKYGERLPKVFINDAPGDEYLEPTRKLMSSVSGGAGVLNFNSTDHPASAQGYSVYGAVEVPACANPCTGLVNTAGIACDAFSGWINLDISEPKLDQHGAITSSMHVPISFPAVKTCTCLAGTFLNAGVCACPDGTSYNGMACVP